MVKKNENRKSILVKNATSNQDLMKAVTKMMVKSPVKTKRESFKVNPEEYRFSAPDSEENIKYVEENGKREVKCASLDKLVEKATYEGHPGK